MLFFRLIPNRVPILGVSALEALGGFLLGLLLFVAARAQEPLSPPPPSQAGCFESSSPATTWQKVPCSSVQLHLIPQARPSAHADRPPPKSHIVGGKYGDYAAQISAPPYIQAALGQFITVLNLNGENVDGFSDNFQLQINTNGFSPPICNGAMQPSQCFGWQQFIFQNQSCPNQQGYPTASLACIYIQYWLYNATFPGAVAAQNGGCPGGWTPQGTGTCYMNSPLKYVPQVTINDLSNLNLSAGEGNGFDSVGLTSISNGQNWNMTQSSVLNLPQGWYQAEFNVVGPGAFGNGAPGTADFTGTPTLVAKLIVGNGVTPPQPVSCVGGSSSPLVGGTGESNNLLLVPPCCPETSSIVFTESLMPGATSICACANSPFRGSSIRSVWDPTSARCIADIPQLKNSR